MSEFEEEDFDDPDDEQHWSPHQASPLVTLGIGVLFGALACAGQSRKVGVIVAVVGIALALVGTFMGYGKDSGPRSRHE
ncbi:hypothetical protein [Calycomorphotria hydatis]|uniref:hypothetical protein n=1 Tax=Calycomorphotria hydatis TaxID=2528027 RepID=UPI0011A607B4|nr:hypothetical protein [Calycomorphotria hydatis]